MVVALLIGVAAPAMSVAAAAATADPASSATRGSRDADIQAFVVSSTDAQTLEHPVSFDVESRAQIAASGSVTSFTDAWINDPYSTVQWPFPIGVPISAAYRSATYLTTFGTVHNGADFTPGAGAVVGAVAEGTVRIATEDGGDYGATVVIDHLLDGQQVSTRYGHMERGSLTVREGDRVSAGQAIGRVGNTGRSTGAHLHLEVILDGVTTTGPVQWIASHTD